MIHESVRYFGLLHAGRATPIRCQIKPLQLHPNRAPRLLSGPSKEARYGTLLCPPSRAKLPRLDQAKGTQDWLIILHSCLLTTQCLCGWTSEQPLWVFTSTLCRTRSRTPHGQEQSVSIRPSVQWSRSSKNLLLLCSCASPYPSASPSPPPSASPLPSAILIPRPTPRRSYENWIGVAFLKC